VTDVLEGISNALYNFGSFMLQLLGFQLVGGQWRAPSWNDFIQRVIEIVIISLVTIFMIKYVLLRIL